MSIQDQVINIFIGYDRRLPVASSVLMHSITKRSSLPVRFCLLNLDNLKGIYKREVNPLQSTEFSFSRFLTPYMSNYSGWSIFMDNDIIALEDIAKLWEMRDDKYAVMCVKHDHVPPLEKKFMDAPQTKYAKKNWSSVLMFNNDKCRALTLDYVNEATGMQLHQFKWLNDDNLIGEIPPQWNILVDYHHPEGKPCLLHYTDGGPFYPDYQDCSFNNEWYKEFIESNFCKEADIFKLVKIIKDKKVESDTKVPELEIAV